jgi:methionine synthase II (cobalamin-independent)
VTRPWPPGAVTGIGSLPGTDPADAVALVFGELPDLPHLPELPDRGAGADMIGRTAALLVDLPVELVPSGWQIAAHLGRDVRRARDLLARDLDALEQQAAGYGGALKLQATGPLTLAAAIELRTGHKIVTDSGALRDLTESLAEGVAAHLAEVGSRVPGARLVLQLDEPSLPTVLAGEVRTPSGYGTVRAVDPQVAEQAVRTVLGRAPEGGRVVHCCAAEAPIALLRAAGADAVAVDAALIGVKDYDALGEAVEGGMALWLGVVPSTDRDITLDRARSPIRRVWSELGFDPELLATTVVATPTCGLAGASPAYVRRALALLRDVGRDSLEPS